MNAIRKSAHTGADEAITRVQQIPLGKYVMVQVEEFVPQNTC